VKYVEGAGVLLLLSVFFAHVLAPVVPAVRRRVRVGRRRRPVSEAAALLMIYFVLFAPLALMWPRVRDGVTHFVRVTAPTTVDRLFTHGPVAPIDHVLARLPLPGTVTHAASRAARGTAETLERETRATLAQCIEAAKYARWLALAPVIAFLLLTGAPAFQRSALRVLPRGHLQWRAEEYLRDVNSAIAGYVRAQAAAGVIVGLVSVVAFALLGVAGAMSLGVTSGVLELVPALGPLTMLIIAAGAAGPKLVPVVIFLGALRVAQDYVVYPRLVRRGMHLSTLTVIVTIWIGAVLAGAAGVILAIPVAGFLSVSLRHWREYRDIEQLVATVK
jgi:predicted PurR-regulated permease PerM